MLNIDKAHKGINMGVALGEEEFRGELYRHYKLYPTMEEANAMRRELNEVNNNDQEDNLSAMYSFDLMHSFVLAGGKIGLWTSNLARQVAPTELRHYRAPWQPSPAVVLEWDRAFQFEY